MVKITVSDQVLQQANQRGKFEFLMYPAATKVYYTKRVQKIVLVLNNGGTFSIPTKFIQILATAMDSQISDIILEGAGTSLYWPQLDEGLTVQSLLEGRFGNRRWMENLCQQFGIPIGYWPDVKKAMSELGKIGGSVTSKKKIQSSKSNGQLGGRPNTRRKDKIMLALSHKYQPGAILTRQEIIACVKAQYPAMPDGSIIPSDFCSNQDNRDPFSGKYHIFEKLGRDRYRLLSINSNIITSSTLLLFFLILFV